MEHGLDVADRLGVMASMRDKQAAAVDGAAETRQRALTLVER